MNIYFILWVYWEKNGISKSNDNIVIFTQKIIDIGFKSKKDLYYLWNYRGGKWNLSSWLILSIVFLL